MIRQKLVENWEDEYPIYRNFVSEFLLLFFATRFSKIKFATKIFL